MPPLVGREFTPDEDRPNGPPAVVLSAELWRTSFGADPSAVGQAIALRGESYTVVGIMPDGFETGARADLWTPLRPSTTGEGGGSNYSVLVGLRNDTSRPQALAELTGIAEELQRQRPADSKGQVVLSLVGLQDGMTAEIRHSLLVVWAAVVVVLVAACVNLAGLMLTRAARRRREMATRLALGSGRAAVVRQLLVEAGVLGIAGGAGGIAVASLAVEGLSWLSRDALDIWQAVAIGWKEAAVAAGLAVVGSLIFGLGPALQASRQSTQSSLISSGRSVAGSTSHWPRRILVVAQVALGVLLLVGSGLLLRTFTHLRGLDPGFDPGWRRLRDRLARRCALSHGRRRREAGRRTRWRERSRNPASHRRPSASGCPMNGSSTSVSGTPMAPRRRTPRSQITSVTYITPGFFDVLRIPVRRGRAFDARDRAGSAPVVIVNEALVRAHFNGADPIGRHLRFSGTVREIVGVVGNVQMRPGWGNNGPLAAMPLAYLPIDQLTDGFVRLGPWVVHARHHRAHIALECPGRWRHPARRRLGRPTPARGVGPGDVRGAGRIARATAAADGAAARAGWGGVGGGRHRHPRPHRRVGYRPHAGDGHPPGTRRHLGQALRTLALPGVVLAGVGATAGLLGAAAAVPLIRHFVWGVSVSDPMTYAGVVVLLLAVATVASVKRRPCGFCGSIRPRPCDRNRAAPFWFLTWMAPAARILPAEATIPQHGQRHCLSAHERRT